MPFDIVVKSINESGSAQVGGVGESMWNHVNYHPIHVKKHPKGCLLEVEFRALRVT